MSLRHRLLFSIAITIAGLFTLQALLFLSLMLTFGISSDEVSYFVIVLLMVHCALLIFLVVMQDSFYVLPSRRQLQRVNFTNVLTLTRISSTPTILYLLILSEKYPITAVTVTFTALVFLTDLLDGRISRRTGQLTRVGQYLDSMSDYAMLIAISIAYVHYGLVSRWFFRLVMFRLLFQWVGMGLLLVAHGAVEPRSSIWGKASVFAVMSLYALALLRLVPRARSQVELLYPWPELAVAGIVGVSIVEKAFSLARGFRHAARGGSDRG
ncbi:MAG: CDP-alcohol phosphatidyltransferase family protein [Spirochaetaceae bacterium]|nr:MAG: CDP-alcohol phosphatidyltransferase family protein [Spirochaetaceae bacterium]